MHQRCTNPKNYSFQHYGARGISVCERWNSFANFFEDMGPRPDGLTLERINNDLGYFKENCKWASRADQILNRRNMNFIEFDGKRLTVNKWAAHLGISSATIRMRIKKMLPIERVLAPTNSSNKGKNTRQKY